MEKLIFEEVLNKICYSIQNAKSYILASHQLINKNDFDLPDLYIDVLKKTNVKIKKRIVFGDYDLFLDFDDNEIFFKNIYCIGNYQRFLLVDDELFFKVDSDFYYTKDIGIISVFKEYFKKHENNKNLG